MQRSASALFAGGNTIDEAVGLITAANSVIQDPIQVGTALKTLTLRLRGAKTELEEAGEDVDGMAESTSQLQAKLKALTHGKVDIMLDADTFKNTTQILREMSKAWEDMTDIERAAALELMGGKRQANILSSLITNFETVEEVIETSMNSSGSAYEENSKWLDSIEGKTYQFTNALQAMWSNMINAEIVKDFIDFGTGAIKFLDSAPGKITAIVAALTGLIKFKGHNPINLFTDLFKSIQNIRNAQTILDGLKLQFPVDNLATEQINRYGDAVSALTAKEQANILAKAGLSKAYIESAMQHNNLTQKVINEAMAHSYAVGMTETEAAAQQKLLTAKVQLTAESYRAQVAKLGEAKATEQVNIATALEQLLAEGVTKEKLEQVIASLNVSAAQKTELASVLGLNAGYTGLLGTLKALFKNHPWMMLFTIVTTVLPLVAKGIDAVTVSAEELREEVIKLTDDYEAAKKSLSENIKALSISSDIDAYKDLETEFSKLTQGVDEYGNNISLTSDEYERYQEICEQIVDINPGIAAGYDSATQAIHNNANALSQLIAFQKEELRLKAQEYVSDENLPKMAQNARNEHTKANSDLASAKSAGAYDLYEVFEDLYSGNSLDGDASHYNDVMRFVLDKLGVEDIDKEIQSYWMQAGQEYNITAFFQDYGEEMQKNISVFGTEYTAALTDTFSKMEIATNNANKKLAKADDGLINTFLQVPISLAEYENLTNAGQKFVTDWIKTDNTFKVDNNATDEAVTATRDKIKDMITDLSSLSVSVNPIDTVSGEELLDSIYTFDASSVDWDKYKQHMEFYVDKFWEAIGGADNKYGIEYREDLLKIFGIDFAEAEQSIAKATEQIAGHMDLTQEAIQEKLNTMSAKQIQAYYSINWNEVDWGNVTTWQDVLNMVNNRAQINEVDTVKTYSVLSEDVAGYNDLLQQTTEIVSDNTIVTQEYKDSLGTLGATQEDLNECFDESNPLMVKNAKALNNLVKTSKKNIANNVALAKSQARLKYANLVKQLRATLTAEKNFNNITRDSARAILSQIDTVEQALYKYQLLEDSLLGVSNAFDEFSKAQEVDSLNTYGDSYVEMAQTIYDAYYKTGEVGSEAVEAAVEAIIDPSVYSKLEKHSDAYHQAIFSAFNKSVLPNFTVNEDSFSLEYSNIEKFVQDGLGKIFTGTSITDFDLVEGMNLEKAMELTGKTKTELYAMFAELKKYSGIDYLPMLDDSIEGRITNINSEIAELNRQKLALLEDGGYEANKVQIDEINQKLTTSEEKLTEISSEAYLMWQEYTKNDAALAALSEIENKQKVLTSEETNTLGIKLDEGQTITVQEAYDRLLAKQTQLEEPTELTATFAIEHINTEIDKLKATLDNNDTLKVIAQTDGKSVETVKSEIQAQIQALEEDKVVLATTFNIELSDEEKKSLEEELNAIEQFKINDKDFTVIANGTSETMQSLKDINAFVIANKSFTTTEYKQTVVTTTHASSTVGSGRPTRVNGTAHKGGTWGAPKTETALTGELGPEMRVRGNRWELIGENGAEFTDIKKGDIIFNHKQTEELLSKGYVTGRGKAYAGGTAYAGLWKPVRPDETWSSDGSSDLSDVSDDLSNAADNISDAADKFEEVFDWVEVRLEEIEEQLDLLNARIENAVGYLAKNQIIDAALNVNNTKLTNLEKGMAEYERYAAALLSKIPSSYRDAAKNGAIAIEEFTGDADEKTLKAIQDYREWAQKAADLKQQIEELKTEIADLAQQKFDNVADQFDNQIGLIEAANDKLDAQISLMEDRGYVAAKEYYETMADNTKKTQAELVKERDILQSVLDEQVKLGNIQVGSDAWYEMIEQLYDVDASIVECTSDLESFQNAINDIYWDNFDELINRYEYLSDETQNLIDLMDEADMVSKPDDEDGWTASEVEWTEEGIASLGLYAQQMEIAEYKSKQYAKAIEDLNKDYKDGKYSESEYLEKLNELKDAQYDSIEAYYEAQEAIKDLNSERIDAIKEGIEKEIEAYEKLINKQKEALDSEKDMADFQKSVAEQQKNVTDIQRKLDALANDHSISAAAKRKQLQAELAKAEYELEELYTDRSYEDKQNALDKELESFQEEKEAEIQKWEEYLENVEQVVTDSLGIIQANASGIYDTLNAKADEYNLTLSNAILTPWQDGALAVSDYQEVFDTAASSTMDQLEQIKLKWQEVIDVMSEKAEVEIAAQEKANNRYISTTATKSSTSTTSKPATNNTSTAKSTPSVGQTVKVKSSATHFSAQSGNARMASFVPGGTYQVMQVGINGDKSQILIGKNGQYTGWVKLTDLEGYAKGTIGVDNDQFAWLDELGEELVMHADGNGRLSFLTKGTSVIPADITKNLMQLGQLNPQDILDRSRPTITAPHITNNNIELKMDIAEVVHIDTVTNETIPNLTKAIDKQLDKYMKNLNNQVRKYSR